MRSSATQRVARYLRAVGGPRDVVRDPEARYWGGRLAERTLVPLGEVRLGHIGFDEWLRRSREKLATDDAAPSGQTAVKEDQSLRFQAITQKKQYEDPIDRIRS